MVPLEQIRSLSGLEFLGAIAPDRLPAPLISALLGAAGRLYAHGTSTCLIFTL